MAKWCLVRPQERMEARRQVISEIVHALDQTANLKEALTGIRQELEKARPVDNCFPALDDSTDAFSAKL